VKLILDTAGIHSDISIPAIFFSVFPQGYSEREVIILKTEMTKGLIQVIYTLNH
jgi:hypothetical protein